MAFRINNGLISLGLRGAQALFAIINLGLAASVTADLNYGYRGSVLILVVSLFTLIYLAFALIPILLGFIFPFVAILVELILLILWFVAFVIIASDVGGATCAGLYYYYSWDYSWCGKSKALIAFSLFEWLLSIATLVLLSYYTITPLSKAGGFNNLLSKRTFVLGGIFSTQAPGQPAGVDSPVGDEDLEKNAEVEPTPTDSPVSAPPHASEPALESAPEPSTTYESQPVNGAPTSSDSATTQK